MHPLVTGLKPERSGYVKPAAPCSPCGGQRPQALTTAFSSLVDRASPSATLCLGFALTTVLRSLVMPAPTSLREDTFLLNLTVETLECNLKRIPRVQLDLAHKGYQRERRPLLRPELFDCD